VSATLTHLVKAPKGCTTTPITSIPEGLTRTQPFPIRPSPLPKHSPTTACNQSQRTNPNPVYFQCPTQRAPLPTDHIHKTPTNATKNTHQTQKPLPRANHDRHHNHPPDRDGTSTFPIARGRKPARSAHPRPPEDAHRLVPNRGVAPLRQGAAPPGAPTHHSAPGFAHHCAQEPWLEMARTLNATLLAGVTQASGDTR
jgi:hypothetical protein